LFTESGCALVSEALPSTDVLVEDYLLCRRCFTCEFKFSKFLCWACF